MALKGDLNTAGDLTKSFDFERFRSRLKLMHPVQLNQLDTRSSQFLPPCESTLANCRDQIRLQQGQLLERCKPAALCSGLALVGLRGLQARRVSALVLAASPVSLPLTIAAAAACYICGPYAKSICDFMRCENASAPLRKRVAKIKAAIGDDLSDKFKLKDHLQLPAGEPSAMGPQQEDALPEQFATASWQQHSTAGSARAEPAAATLATYVVEPD